MVSVLAMIDTTQPLQRWRQHLKLVRAWLHLLAIAITILTTVTGSSRASLMNLPDGIENVLGFVPRSSFQCQADGYFGDIDNDCRLFHLCQRQVDANGRVEWRHWTYACGNQTMFNQLTLTCAFVDEAIPCRHASQFQYLNEVIHKPAEPFLTDADVTSGFSYYSNRVMSDGARARAFHDSQLLSQIGGQQAGGHQQQHQHHHQFAENPSASNSLNSLAAGADNFGGQQVAPTHNFPSLTAQFQSQSQRLRQQQQPQQDFEFRETFSPAHPQSHRAAPGQNSQTNLIEEHAFQLQHQTVAAAADAIAANNQQLQSLQNFGNFISSPPQQQQQPPVPQTQNPPTDSAPVDVTSSSSRQQTFAPAPAVVELNQQSGSGGQPQQSFEFSIATNHQAGASGEPANVFFGQAQPQQQQQQQQPQKPSAQTRAQQFANADELRRQFAAQLPPSAESVAPTTTSTTTAATTTLAAQTTTANVATEPVHRSTSAPLETIAQSTPAATPSPSSPLTPTFTSSQRLAQVAQPTPATSTLGPAPTTTTSATTSTSTSTSSVPPPPPVELRPARRAHQHQPTGRRASAASRAAERTRTPGFQSTRLSSQQKRQAAAAADNSPIVMRKPPIVSSESRVSPAASRADSSSALVSLDEGPDSFTRAGDWSTGGGDFWRRSFDAQLMAPKFESLLLRRRV